MGLRLFTHGGVELNRTIIRARGTLAVLLTLLATSSAASAQTPATEAQVKAAFVYNFLKFVEWPAEAFGGTRDSLVVGIVGTSATAEAAALFLAGKQANSRPIAVRRMTPDAAIVGVHAIFVGDIGDRGQPQVLLEAASTSVLSIGEAKGFATRGGVIGLLVEDQKVRFEINPDAAETAQLKISSKLLALAKLVHGTKREQAP
jgi:hypothetical protein